MLNGGPSVAEPLLVSGAAACGAMEAKGSGSSKGNGVEGVGKKPGQVLAGPRKPTWTCSCGKEGNWASRVSCYECGKSPPAATLKLAREVAAKLGCGISEIGKGQANSYEGSGW